MNFHLSHLPERTQRPRENGVTMVMDKGLSMSQAASMLEVGSDVIDIIKLGFGTSIMSQNFEEKVAFYLKNDLKVYCGGTLFEAFYVRGQLDAYLKMLDKYNINCLEVSDGSMHIDHDEKCELIQRLSKNYTVLSEVGSKEEGILISPAKWIKMMNNELEAGSWKVIAEARESGTVGIYRPNGSAHVMLINKILSKVNGDDILWEAPQKAQQVWFIKLLGANVNLGNISPFDAIPLECLRLGLRGDTFFHFLPEDVAAAAKQS